MYNYGLVGNCHVSALISSRGSVDWLCLPRPDSEPVFGQLLDNEGGRFSIDLAKEQPATSRQHYLENTNVLVTTVETAAGDAFQITDFCPRFPQFGRMYRPLALFRIVEPLKGHPEIRVSCHPIRGWNKEPAAMARGSTHLRFDIRNEALRLLTTMPVTHLCDEHAFPLREKIYFALSWGVNVEDDLVEVAERFLRLTCNYWRSWVKNCSIPSQFQKETIRSALTLKLHCFEDTGAILAALTTSLPEDPGGVRNWDYRYCWLRDAYFVLTALHNLGHFEEMEGFVTFLLNLAFSDAFSMQQVRPVYSLDLRAPLPEIAHMHWQGFASSKPVRTGNQAAEHVQNDVFGEMVLTLAPIFFDERFIHLRTRDHERLLENFGRACAQSISQPDAGLWEHRQGWKEHTFSNLMCWAGLERLERIKQAGYLRTTELNFTSEKDRAAKAVCAAVVDGALRNSPTDTSLDAALALLPVLRFPDQALALRTITTIRKRLSAEGHEDGAFFYRYLRTDDFGTPGSAFVVCSFWIAQALAAVGQREDAAQLLRRVLTCSNEVGLLSEHYLPAQRQHYGNFPQAYSHVGVINAAFAVSTPWSEVL